MLERGSNSAFCILHYLNPAFHQFPELAHAAKPLDADDGFVAVAHFFGDGRAAQVVVKSERQDAVADFADLADCLAQELASFVGFDGLMDGDFEAVSNRVVYFRKKNLADGRGVAFQKQLFADAEKVGFDRAGQHFELAGTHVLDQNDGRILKNIGQLFAVEAAVLGDEADELALPVSVNKPERAVGVVAQIVKGHAGKGFEVWIVHFRNLVAEIG